MPGIDGGVEERVEVVVGERLATPCVQLALPAVVAAEHEQRGRAGNPLLRQGPSEQVRRCGRGSPASSTMTMSRCCRSLLVGDDSASAHTVSINAGATRAAGSIGTSRGLRVLPGLGADLRPLSGAIPGSAAPNLCASVSRIFFMASSIDVTLAWVAAELSPRRRHLGDAGQRLVRQRQVDGLVALGREVGGRDRSPSPGARFPASPSTGGPAITHSRKWIVSGPICPANTWSTYSPGMVDIGNCVPSVIVLSQLSRCVSSRNSEPSVPVISIQVAQ